MPHPIVTQLVPPLFLICLSTAVVLSGSDAYESICDDMLQWTELQPLVRALGVHYPNSDAGANCPAVPLPLWASEDFSSYFEAGGCWARLLNRNYVLANMTATIAWNLISGLSRLLLSVMFFCHLTSRNLSHKPPLSLLSLFLGAAYYDDLPWPGDALMHAPEPWSGFYELGQVFWATAHTTQFTSIGWRYLGHGTGVGVLDYGGTFVSLTDSQGNLTIIMETITPDNSACPHERPF